jgi:4-hydroxy-tetrahydrodipicolinate reductase
MKVALIGYGAMGKLVERLAIEKGYEIGVIVDDSDANSFAGEVASKLEGCDVAIDFTVAMAVKRNVEACVTAHVPLVLGTTGWQDQRSQIEQIVKEWEGTLLFGANFSIGVNLFYKVIERAAELFAKFPEYEVFIEEQHHSRKKDAPSGTALKIQEILERQVEVQSVAATRAGNIPGTHRVGFDGKGDQILLEHSARSREGFAAGAIIAAEWVIGKKGFFEFTDVIDEISGGAD